MSGGVFSNLAAIKSNTGGVWFKPGNFTVEIRAVKLIMARDGNTTFVVETRVLESNNLELPPGSNPSQVVKIKNDNNRNSYLSNVKAFAAAALGVVDADTFVPPEAAHLPAGPDRDAVINQWWEQALLYLTDEGMQPMRGKVMSLTVQNITTRQGNPFTKHFWNGVVDVPGQA